MKQDSGIITARQAHGLLTLAIGAALFYSSGSFARPDLQPLGPNIADKGSAFYHFTQRQYDSADGERHYRVWTAVPDKAPPAAGYPVLYMLDGNAVMDKLNDAFLQQLSAGSPPVIVAIGYQTALPFDTQPGPGITLRRLRRINLAPENPRCRREKPGVMTCFASC